MDRDTRNLLANTTQALRRGLEEEFARQLEGRFDVLRDGSIATDPSPQLDDSEKLTRCKIVEAIHHRRASGENDQESVDGFLRETAFTFLNRLAALKMMEARGIVQECVSACDSHGFNARGFKEFGGLAPGLIELADGGYRLYLECLFDEIGREVGILFDRTDPASLLWPRRAALLDALGRINDPKLAGIWGEDETIGWIYQYYNDPEERRKMRDVKQGGSAAPRNSREMAVRNQFFTPRYVVEFLTDNALGRLWYEMTKGKTSLKDRCRYLIKRPVELFLPGPETYIWHDALGLEEFRRFSATASPHDLPANPAIGMLLGWIGLMTPDHLFVGLEGIPRPRHELLDTILIPLEAGNHHQELDATSTVDLLKILRRISFEFEDNGYGPTVPVAPVSENPTLATLWAALRSRLIHPPENLSKEEQLQQPVFIPHRPLKDPRQIRLIDPACGSMHFGLYSFDLLLVIYEDAWDLGVCQDLQRDYPTKEEFMKDVPRLILEHNIHGIDIDPRATQIAGLALWLRSQKAWQQQGLRPAERPTITRSNIVCAEPMPGEKDLLLRFVERSFQSSERPFFTRLLSEIFLTMRLAGEAGSLLKIEDDVSALIADARAQWKKIGKRDGDFFSQAEILNLDRRTILQQPLDTGTWSLDALSGIPNDRFWDKAEERIYQALRDFAESAGGNYQRRLFADDAAHGFAFIDLCRQRYDVALMNPPFGDASLPSKPYLDETYGDTKGDVYKAFVECFQARLVPAGFLGIISSRTGFFLGQSEDWRTRVVLRLFRPIALADLGMGVLDAMVEVAAYVLRSLSESEIRDLTHSIVPTLEKVVLDKQERFSLPKWQTARNGLKRHQAVAELEHLEAEGFIQRDSGEIVRYSPLWHSVKNVTATPTPIYPPLVCVRALAEQDKGTALAEGLKCLGSGNTFVCDPNGFREIPNATFAYWVGSNVQALFRRNSLFAVDGRQARRGPSTGDDTRRVRCWWEIHPSDNSRDRGWARLSKGGSYSPFYYDVHLVVSWEERRFTYSGFFGRPGRMLAKLESSDCFFRPGLTWPRRSQKGLSVRPLPDACIFADKSPTAFVSENDSSELLAYLAVTNSSAFRGLIALQMAFGSYETGVFQQTPVPQLPDESRTRFAELAKRAWSCNRKLNSSEAISNAFIIPAQLAVSGNTLAERSSAWSARLRDSEETVATIKTEIDDHAFCLYGLDETDRLALTTTLATESIDDDETSSDDDDEEDAACADTPALTAGLLDYTIGAAFGRWDLRFATGEKPAPPEPDPFDPLPVCPPGMLQNADGLPATPTDVPADYPLRISWSGILVDDKGHDEDIETRAHEVLAVVFPDHVAEIAHEACGILGVKTLREFFRKPAAFFAGHHKRHSKSRRQAPIYWPISSPNGLYTLWLYYPRLTADTLFTALRDFLEPKLQYEEGRAFRLRQDAGPTPAPSQRAEIAEADELVDDLRALRDELKRVAPLFKPDLNDGVILNYAPLWRMIGLPKWRKDCQATWEKLAAGDYDWAHLALHLWPERIIPKCATDRSLAIAHGLESTFWEEIPADELPTNQRGRGGKKKTKPEPIPEPEDETPDEEEAPTQGAGKWRPKKVPAGEFQHLIATRTSPAVRAALDALETTSVIGGAKKKTKATARK
jgi:hypothetical protein